MFYLNVLLFIKLNVYLSFHQYLNVLLSHPTYFFLYAINSSEYY